MLFEVQSLAGRRGRRPVFRDISFTLSAGDVLLVTGPNGSGKSSLLRVLAGLLSPADGVMRWAGQPIDPALHKTRLHYLGHLDAVKPELTAAEMMDYWRTVFAPSSSQKLPENFGLQNVTDKPTRYLSAGQKRRLALTRLLIHDMPLWLLDEPATALDRDGQELLSSLIAQHRAKGGIAIIAAHQDVKLPDAQLLTLGKAT
ncbi:MAG: heme ABC exporter ATP-binding protein CcmA [Alphaproteobacteria bacterium]|nr:heme ABC exporter ATP-binding protein CcmA [Alphaproteobacteria bacterium]